LSINCAAWEVDICAGQGAVGNMMEKSQVSFDYVMEG
jgi:hypothetical protein